MNSSEKIRKIVKRVLKATEYWRFEILMRQFIFLRNYVDRSFDENEKNWYDRGYKCLTQLLLDEYEQHTETPGYLLYRFEYAFSNELIRNRRTIFETYKLLYILKIIGNKKTVYNCDDYQTQTNIEFVELLLKNANYQDDSNLFQIAKMIKSIKH